MKALALLLAAAAGRAVEPTPLVSPEGWQPLPAIARPALNVLERPLELQFFFKALREIEKGGKNPRVLRIVQLGDSHLQSGHFSQWFRQKIQLRFGDAGRGLVFPYDVARTTVPVDLASASDTVWMARRMAGNPPSGAEWLEAGASGFALFTHAEKYLLQLRLRSGRFDRISLFRRRGPSDLGVVLSVHEEKELIQKRGLAPKQRLYEVKPGDSLYAIAKEQGLSLDKLKSLNRLKSDNIFPGEKLVVGTDLAEESAATGNGFRDLLRLPGGASKDLMEVVDLENEVDSVYLRGFAQKQEQEEALWWGMSLERKALPGVLYHSVGVNGAELRHYAKNDRVLDQLRALEPDLVILSLGTNDANNSAISPAEMEASLLKIIRGFSHGAGKYVAFLLMTPPDTLYWKGRLNPRSATVSWRLREFARRHGLALWDWQEIMGGPGSVLTWREEKLVWTDGVHFTPQGYRWQAELFWKALEAAYERP